MKALLPIVASVLIARACSQVPSLVADGILHPARHRPQRMTPSNCNDQEFAGDGVLLRGWVCRAAGPTRGTVVYLHGIADNRDSSVGVIQRFTTLGLDVVAYDSRAHGASEGEACTYGYFEKNDLRRIIDTIRSGPVLLMGVSLGGAVALQEAPDDKRVVGVIAAEVFSDLETIARERAPSFFPGLVMTKAFRLVERRGGFSVRTVRPVEAAARIAVPVLLVHGEADTQTSPDHSRRIVAALAGSKRLIVVPRAGHNESLKNPDIWVQIERWMQEVLKRSEGRANTRLHPTAAARDLK